MKAFPEKDNEVSTEKFLTMLMVMLLKKTLAEGKMKSCSSNTAKPQHGFTN